MCRFILTSQNVALPNQRINEILYFLITQQLSISIASFLHLLMLSLIHRENLSFSCHELKLHCVGCKQVEGSKKVFVGLGSDIQHCKPHPIDRRPSQGIIPRATTVWAGPQDYALISSVSTTGSLPRD